MVGARPFRDLPKIFDKLRVRSIRALNITMQETVRITHSKAVRTTRVDTGLARSNWVVTFNAPFSGVIPPYRPGVMRGIGERANAQAAIRQGIAAVRRWRVEGNNAVVYITNNTPYTILIVANFSDKYAKTT